MSKKSNIQSSHLALMFMALLAMTLALYVIAAKPEEIAGVDADVVFWMSLAVGVVVWLYVRRPLQRFMRSVAKDEDTE